MGLRDWLKKQKKKSQSSAQSAYKEHKKAQNVQKKKKASSSSYDSVRQKANSQPKTTSKSGSTGGSTKRPSGASGGGRSRGSGSSRGNERRSGAYRAQQSAGATVSKAGSAIRKSAENTYKGRKVGTYTPPTKAGQTRVSKAGTSTGTIKNRVRSSANAAYQEYKKNPTNAVGTRPQTHEVDYGNQRETKVHVNKRQGTASALSKGAIKPKVITEKTDPRAARTYESQKEQRRIAKETEKKQGQYKKEYEKRSDDSLRRQIAWGLKNGQFGKVSNDNYQEAFDAIYNYAKNSDDYKKAIDEGSKEYSKKASHAYRDIESAKSEAKIKEKYGEVGRLKYEDLNSEDFQDVQTALRMPGDLGRQYLKNKGKDEKIGSTTAGTAGKNAISKFATGVMQGSGVGDVTRGPWTYNKDAQGVMKDVKESGAYMGGNMAGLGAALMVGGIEGGAGRAFAKVGLKAGEKAAEAEAKAAGRTAVNNFIRNRAGELITESPINLADAIRMSTDEKGNVDTKQVLANMALNSALTVGMGGAMEGAGAGLTKRLGKKAINLQEKVNAGIATPEEQRDLLQAYTKLSNKAKEGTVSSTVAETSIRNLDESLTNKISESEARDYFRLKAIQSQRNLVGKEDEKLKELTAKMYARKFEYESKLKTIVDDSVANIEKATSGDVARLSYATDYYTKAGMKSEAKATRTAYQKALKNFNNTVDDVTKAAAKVSNDLGREFKIESADEIAEAFARTGGKVDDPTQIHGFAEFDKDGNIVSYHVNKDSEQAMEFTFGHELTHGFESLGKEYDDFASALKKYVGDDEWNEMLDSVGRQYANVANADLEKETVANLVGKHLFSGDGKFLDHMLNNEPSLFQRLYEVVKKLLNGTSKRDAQLEALSKQMDDMFDKLSAETKSIMNTKAVKTEMLYGGEGSIQDGLDSISHVPERYKESVQDINVTSKNAIAELNKAKETFADDPIGLKAARLEIRNQLVETISINMEYAKSKVAAAVAKYGDDYKKIEKVRDQVFKETGCFQAATGHWEYIIDDRGMKFKGSNKIPSKEVAKKSDILYYNPETAKVEVNQTALDNANKQRDQILKEISKKKTGKKRKAELRKEGERLLNKLNLYAAFASEDGVPMGDIIDHELLYLLYPRAETSVHIKLDTNTHNALAYTVKGDIDHPTKIVLNANMLADDSFVSYQLKTLKRDVQVEKRVTLVHEIQHALQGNEGRPGGGGKTEFMWQAGRPLSGNESILHIYPKVYDRDRDALADIILKRDIIERKMRNSEDGGEADYAIGKYWVYVRDSSVGKEGDYNGVDITTDSLRALYPEASDAKIKELYIEDALDCIVNDYKADIRGFEDDLREFISADYDASLISETDSFTLYKQLSGEVEARSAAEIAYKEGDRQQLKEINADQKTLLGHLKSTNKMANVELTTQNGLYAKFKKQFADSSELENMKSEMSRDDFAETVYNYMLSEPRGKVLLLGKDTEKIVKDYLKLEHDKIGLNWYGKLKNGSELSKSRPVEYGENVRFKGSLRSQDPAKRKATEIKNLNRLKATKVINKQVDKELPNRLTKNDSGLALREDPDIELSYGKDEQLSQGERADGRKTLSAEDSEYYERLASEMAEHEKEQANGVDALNELGQPRSKAEREWKPSREMLEMDREITRDAMSVSGHEWDEAQEAAVMKSMDEYDAMPEWEQKFNDEKLFALQGTRKLTTFKQQRTRLRNKGEWNEEAAQKVYDKIIGKQKQPAPETGTPKTKAKSKASREIADDSAPTKEMLEMDREITRDAMSVDGHIFDEAKETAIKESMDEYYSLPEWEQTFNDKNLDQIASAKKMTTFKQQRTRLRNKGEWNEETAQKLFDKLKEKAEPEQRKTKQIEDTQAQKPKPTESKKAEPSTKPEQNEKALPDDDGLAAPTKSEPVKRENGPATNEEANRPLDMKGVIERARRKTKASDMNASAIRDLKEMADAHGGLPGLAELIRKDGGFGKYKNKSATEALSKAEADLDEIGYEDLLKNFLEAGFESDPYTLRAQGITLLNEISRRIGKNEGPEGQLWADAYNVVEKNSSMTGFGSKVLLAQKAFLTSTRDGRIRTVLKEIERLEKRYADRIKGGKLEVDRAKLEELADATGKRKDELLDEINKELWEQIPASLMERLNEYRHCFMLFNAKTHGRNAFGNAVFRVVRRISDDMESAILKAAKGHIKNLDENATINKTFVSRKEIYDNRGYLKNEFEAIYRQSGSKNKYIESSRPDGVPTVKFKPMQKAIDFNYKLLEKEDLGGALVPAFNKAYMSYCKARCPKGTDLRKFMEGMTDAQKNAARHYALEQGEYATFRDTCAFSDWLIGKKQTFANAKGKTKWGTFGYRALDAVLEGSIPFVKTPVNIFRRSVDYSPASLIMSVGKLANAKSAEEFMLGVHQLSTGLTGTGIMGLGVYLSHQGLMTVRAGEESGDAYMDRDMGFQDYSLILTLNDGHRYSFSLDWLAPTGMSLFAGAAFQKMFEKDGFDNQSALNAFFACTSPITDMSFMSSPKDTVERFLENASRGSSEKEIDFAGALAQLIVGDMPKNYVSGFFPQLTSQLAGAIDPYQRDTKSTKENVYLKGWESSARQLANRVPFLRQAILNPKINRRGEEVKTWLPDDNIATRLANAFLNPANVKYINENETDRALIDIRNHMDKDSDDYRFFYYNFTGNPSYSLANGKRMTYDEAYTYGKASRIEQNDRIKAMLDAPSYDTMTWKMRADEVDDAHWVGTTVADMETYNPNYAMKALLKDNAREAETVKEYKRLSENDGRSGTEINKAYLDYYIDKERLHMRSHAVGDDAYRIKALTALQHGDEALIDALDIHKSKLDDAGKYWEIIKEDSKSTDEAKGKAFDEVSDFFCRIMSNTNRAEIINPSKGVKSVSAGMVAADGNQFTERVYRGMGYNWNAAQSGGGLMLAYNKDGKYSIEKIQEMKTTLRTQFDVDESGSVNKKDVIAYIDSLGIESDDEKACLYEVLYSGGNYKNPYKAEIDDHLKWGENKDDEWGDGKTSGHGWGRRRRRGRRRHGGRGGGGGSGSADETPATPSGAYAYTGGKVTKARVTDTYRAHNTSSPSNLNDAYRKRLAKLKEESRKTNKNKLS